MSREHNSSATGTNMCNAAGAGGTSTICMDDGAGLKLAKGRRAKRAKVKRGMRGSGERAKRHRLRTFNLTKKGMCKDEQNMSAEEVKSILQWRK